LCDFHASWVLYYLEVEKAKAVKLKEAATRKLVILIQIDDKDLVALEVKYHKHCYEKCTAM
jgi:hypothetical protein